VTKPKTSRGLAVALIIGGDVVLLLMGWFLLVSPQRQTAKSTAQAVNATQAQLHEAERLLAQPPAPAAAPKQPAIRTADLYRLAKAMPTSTDVPDVLLELDQVARAAGVTLDTIQPGQPVAATGYDVYAINVTASGDFYALTDMLYRLRTLVSVRDGALDATGRLFTVDSVSLAPSGTGNDLSAKLLVDAYVYGNAATNPAGAVTTPAPSTTPSSTATTQTSTTTASADAAP
jgi:Tfp pilus assembly protein PilO